MRAKKVSGNCEWVLLFFFCSSAVLFGQTNQIAKKTRVFQPVDTGRTVYQNKEILGLNIPLTRFLPGEYEVTVDLRALNDMEKPEAERLKIRVVQPRRATMLEKAPGNRDSDHGKIIRIYAINVNEETIGDAFLIVVPGGKTMLIDGGYPDYGKNVILPFLRRHGIMTIDYLVCSHPHSDHMGGISEIILSKEVTVKQLLRSTILSFEELKKLSNDFEKGEVEAYQALQVACTERNLPITEVREDQIIDLGHDVKIEILAVAKPEIKVSNYINNNSIIMRLRYGRFSMIFTGDAGFEEEDRVIAKGLDLTTDILKVGHHAGAGSTGVQWMHALDAQVAIAPMPDWLLKDPRGERVFNQLMPTGVKFYHTGGYGNIEIQSDGTRFWLVTEKMPTREKMPKEEPYMAPIIDKVLYSLPLVWQFKTDPKNIGLTPREWNPTKKDLVWKPIRVDKDWTSQGYKYHGSAWYSIMIKIPKTIISKDQRKLNNISLYFNAIDGTADIFMDGQWIGEQKHDVGVMWDKAFVIPLPTDFDTSISHRLTVRVQKDICAAGIWKPVCIATMVKQ